MNNRNIELDLEFRKDFLSVDGQTAISSHGSIFTVGDIVGHEGASDKERAEIKSFTLNTETMDVIAHTERGEGRIVYLYLTKD